MFELKKPVRRDHGDAWYVNVSFLLEATIVQASCGHNAYPPALLLYYSARYSNFIQNELIENKVHNSLQ